MIPTNPQFDKGHARATEGINNAVKLTKGLANIYSNTNLSSDQKDAAVKALHESVKGSKSTEPEYEEAMSQDPRYMTDEDKQELGNHYDKQAKERNQ